MLFNLVISNKTVKVAMPWLNKKNTTLTLLNVEYLLLRRHQACSGMFIY